MDGPLAMKSWSPYVVGIGIGVLSWFAFATANRPIGVTTAFESAAALTERAVDPTLEVTNAYYAKKEAEQKPPKIDWEMMLVVGIFVGAFASSQLSGDRHSQVVESLWRSRFGSSAALRMIVAFLAGGLMMFGARMAHGCTSGHGISGTLQLAVSSWVFISVAFGVGIGTTWLMYGSTRSRSISSSSTDPAGADRV